ncbi:MAG: GMC family oxidoreductase [bacterium]
MPNINSFNKDWDIIVVGTGAGGATVAREMARRDRSVLMLEKGANNKWIGSHLPALFFVDKGGFLYSKEGINIIRAITTGGSTLVFTGTAARPPAWLAEKYNIDISAEVEDTEKELRIQPLPEHLIGKSSFRVMEAANELGFRWEFLPKFIDPEKCIPHCSKCIIGCRRGAKWTAREYIKEAVQKGAVLKTRTDVREVIVDGGVAVGVRAHSGGSAVEYRGKTVVVSAGGLGTPPILQRTGIGEAGREFFCDPAILTYGRIKGRGTNYAVPMTVGSYEFYDSDGIMLSHLIDTRITFLQQMFVKGFSHLPKWLFYDNTLGIMTKAKDDIKGQVNLDGTFSKPLTNTDIAKLDKGAAVAKKILTAAGVDSNTIFSTAVRGTHPGGTARIGRVVNSDLQTEIKNLYVCDASVFPESPDRPMVLMIIGMAKRLAKKLSQN